jgi:hypothetical protein
MKPLETAFVKQGYKYKLVEALDGGYIFEKYSLERAKSAGFECFLHKEQKETTMKIDGQEIQYPAKVRYPNDNDFGVWAWYCHTLEKAFAKIQLEIQNRKINQ